MGTEDSNDERPSPVEGPVVLFDGVCNLCHAAVAWIVARDRRRRFRFAALQSRAGRALVARARGATDAPLPDSVVLIELVGGELRARTRSDAAIEIARGLGFPWSLLACARVLPRGARDALYSFVARHRYRWFGRQTACLRPTPELARRFLDADE